MRKVAVVGGGIAGLFAVFYAAIEGAEVTLFEEHMYGEQRVNCGETFINLYGLGKPIAGVRFEPRYSRFRINGASITERCFILPQNAFFVTDRKEHENALFQRCLDKGVKVIFKKVTIKEILPNFDVLIDATGYPSQSHKEEFIGTPKLFGKAISYGVTGGFEKYYNAKELFLLWQNVNDGPYSGLTKGYFWLFPKSKDEANIGYGEFGDLSRDNKLLTKKIKECMQELDLDYEVKWKGGGKIPLEPLDCLSYRNVLLVGDAAGLVNAGFGCGEHLAAISGKIAGSLVAKKRENAYDSDLRKMVWSEIQLGRAAAMMGKNAGTAQLEAMLSFASIVAFVHWSFFNMAVTSQGIMEYLDLGMEMMDNQIENFIRYLVYKNLWFGGVVDFSTAPFRLVCGLTRRQIREQQRIISNFVNYLSYQE